MIINRAKLSNDSISQQGLSLVELLISMAVGLILLAGMIAVFSGNKRSAELNAAMSNIQENARFALTTLSKDIRMAGYQGCLDSRRGRMTVKAANSPVPQDGFKDNGEPKFNFNASLVTGSVVIDADNWSPAIPGGFDPPEDNPSIPGTDVLTVQYGDRVRSTLPGPIVTADVPSLDGPIVTTDDLGVRVGDLVLIASCDNVDLIEVTGVANDGDGQSLAHAAPRNVDGNLSARYGLPNDIAHTRVMRFRSHVYYIGDTGLVNETGDSIRALYQQSYPYNDPNNPPAELAQGVENMRISYGLRQNNTLRYVSANDPVFNPEDVESVQIGLIMTSYERIAEQDDINVYVIAGQPIPPAADADSGLSHAQDRRYRLVFNTTVKVRNRRDDRVFFSQTVDP